MVYNFNLNTQIKGLKGPLKKKKISFYLVSSKY